MAQYTISNLNAGTAQNLASTAKTILAVTAVTGATTLRRGWIMEWEIGASDVPNATDCPINWSMEEQTAAGTITSLTPRFNDLGGGDAAALLTYTANATIEGTVTATSWGWNLPLNQRASYRIQMRDNWSAMIVPAVNAKGWAMRAKSPNYASTVSWRALVQE